LHESRVSGWQFVGSAYLPCVKGREARADGSFSRNQLRSTPGWGSRVNGYDVGCDGSLNRSQHAHDRWVARFIEVCTTTGVSGLFLRSLFTGRAHGKPRPAGQRVVLRKGFGGPQGGRTELGAGSFVPEGDASDGASSSQGESPFDAETSEVGR